MGSTMNSSTCEYELSSSSNDGIMDTLRFSRNIRCLTIPLELQQQLKILAPGVYDEGQPWDQEDFPILSELPKEIGSLTNLRELDLTCCENIKSLPSSIGKLKNLQKIHLSNAKISELPEEIGELTKLRELIVDDCFKMESIPSSIGRLKKLEKLDLSYANISELPEEIGNLTNLRELVLRANKEIKSLPSSIGRLKKMEILSLVRTPVSELPDAIGELSNLRELSLSSCSNIESLPSSFGQLKQLEKLNLRRTTQLSELPDDIGELSNLRELNLLFCRNIKSLPSSFGQLKKLDELALDITFVLQSPQEIGNLENMRKLIVSLDNGIARNNNWKDRVKQFLIKSIHSCPKLQVILDSNFVWYNEETLCLQSHLALNRARLRYPTVPQNLWSYLISNPRPLYSDIQFNYRRQDDDNYMIKPEVIYRALVESSLHAVAMTRGQRKSQPKPNKRRKLN